MSGVWPTYMIVYLLGTVFMVANFKNLAASMIGFAAGVLLPIAIVFLFNMYLERVSRKLS